MADFLSAISPNSTAPALLSVRARRTMKISLLIDHSIDIRTGQKLCLHSIAGCQCSFILVINGKIYTRAGAIAIALHGCMKLERCWWLDSKLSALISFWFDHRKCALIIGLVSTIDLQLVLLNINGAVHDPRPAFTSAWDW